MNSGGEDTSFGVPDGGPPANPAADKAAHTLDDEMRATEAAAVAGPSASGQPDLLARLHYVTLLATEWKKSAEALAETADSAYGDLPSTRRDVDRLIVDDQQHLAAL